MAAFETRRRCKTLSTKASKLHTHSNLVKAIEHFRSASHNFQVADREYLDFQKNSKQKRKDFQRDLAKDISEQKGTEAAKEIKSLMYIEQQRPQSMRLQTVLKPRSGGGPNSILIPAITEYQRPYPCDFDYKKVEFIWQRIEFDNREDIINWERINDQRLVEAMLLRWQQQHFMRANETPVASSFWHKELQNKEVQEAILEGTYDIPASLPLEAREILKEMKRPDLADDECVPDANEADFREYIKK